MNEMNAYNFLVYGCMCDFFVWLIFFILEFKLAKWFDFNQRILSENNCPHLTNFKEKRKIMIFKFKVHYAIKNVEGYFIFLIVPICMQVWLSILMDGQHFYYNRKMNNNNCYTCFLIMI